MSDKKSILSELKEWKSVVIMVLLMVSGVLASQGLMTPLSEQAVIDIANTIVKAEVEAQLRAMMEIEVNSRYYRLQEPESNVFITQVGSNYVLVNSTTKLPMDYDTNVTLVEEWAVGNVTDGIIFLDRISWNTSISVPANAGVIEAVQGDISYFGVSVIGDSWINATNINAAYLYQDGVIVSSTDGGAYSKITATVQTAAALEIVIESLANNTDNFILANWTGSSTASTNMPRESLDIDISIIGLGRSTEIQGRTNEPTFNATFNEPANWADTSNYIRFYDLTVTSDSAYVLDASFWHTTVNNVIWNIDADDNSKGIIIGGSGADAPPSTWTDYTLNHIGGVTGNSMMRIWLETFISINANVVLKTNAPVVDIGYIWEMMGTRGTFINTNIHHWQGRDILGAIWRTNGDGFSGTIIGLYNAESGGTGTVINSVFRVSTADDSYFYASGRFHLAEDDMITQLFYDEWSGEHTMWDGHLTGGTAGSAYEYDPIPPAITFTMIDRLTSTTGWTAPGATWVAYTAYNNFTINLTGFTKIMIFGEATGSSAGGNQGLSVWDSTNEEILVAWEWSGASRTAFQNATIIQGTTGDIEISFAGYQDNGGNIALFDVYCVVW